MEPVVLTSGAITTISEGGAEGMKPMVQVHDIRLVNTAQNTAERYRMMLSDGTHTQQAMLATQMNLIVKSGRFRKGSIVRLNEFICNVIQGRRIIIVINLEVIVSKHDIIGEPKQYDTTAAGSQLRAPVSAQPSGMNQSSIPAGNPQSYGGSHSGSSLSGQNVAGRSSMYANAESVTNPSSFSNSFASGAPSGRNMNNINSHYPRAEQGGGASNDMQVNGGYQNQRFSNPVPAGGYRPPANAYDRTGQPTYAQPPPLYTNRGPIAKNEAPARIIPIAALNPYQGRWTIKARVTAKGELRRYSNPRGEGKVFSFDLLDSDGGEIRVTCFNMVADQFYDKIEVGRVYLISKGSLKPSQKSFNHLNNEYEIFLESTSTVQLCLEEDNTIPKQQFNFRPISEIEGMENNSMLDVIGVVSSINPSGTVLRKNGTETQKRTLQLKDMSGRSVEITLWGNFCNAEGQQLQTMCDSGMFPVLAVKAGRVSDFNGKSLGTIGSSQLFIDPDFPEAHRLREWYNRDGKNLIAPSISKDSSSMGRTDVRKTVSQIKDEGLGRSDRPDWITVKATVSFIKADNFCYTACPLMVGDRQCNKKVNNNGDGTWHCDRCDKSFPECDYRYLLQFQIQDHTGMTWVTAFQECGEEIMGASAKEMYLLKYEEQDDVRFAENIRKVLFNEYLFKLKVKEETFSDEQRLKSTVVKAEKVNPSLESRYLLGLIERLSKEDLNGSLGNPGGSVSGFGMNNGGYSNMSSMPGTHSVGNNFGGNIGADNYRTGAAITTEYHANEYGGPMNNSSFGARGAYVSCNNCGSVGHTIQNCPRSSSMPAQMTGGNFMNRSANSGMDGGNAQNVCFKCQQPGHWARDCPGLGGRPSAYGTVQQHW
ncbi:LOW QUALITY PROTEIN: replication protein A 70 kDa DNA-binding subunit A-like [Dioscorea cayenensis subsp. rotundata]|uniref:Replication protein A subunit n=1 Tax=Dioscorea cayennensis subsp. rotundata TaxID=55577 RepID=A0AB40BQM5_DIOCR|nr:LOW QUALITY PROTEIN: replication protein A 70 kDa DNA-binding subunit A-like [Dioscorea cayenensis subsp. rotundata]